MNEARPTGTAVAVQLPTDARELMLLAKDIATSRLIPAHFQKSPADCFMLMSFCRDKGLNFFATVGHCHVVQNRLFFDGQLCAALLNISGFLADRLNYSYERDKNGTATAVVVSARMHNETMHREARVELKKVQTANKVWETQPEQQLAYSGARQWGRRYLPEVLLGMTFDGETIDVTPTDVTNTIRNTPPLEAPTISPAMEQAARSAAMEEEIQRERKVEPVKPHAIERHGDDELAWRDWVGRLMAFVHAAASADEINDWTTENFEQLTELQKASVPMSDHTIKMVNLAIEKHIKQGT